jgi:hypothetical protein
MLSLDNQEGPMTKQKPTLWTIAASFFVAAWISASPASAEVRVYTLSLPATIPDPTAEFTINYSMGGSEYGNAYVYVNFYLSTTSNGRSGAAYLYSVPMSLSGSGAGPYYPPSGTRSQFIQMINLSPSARSLLQRIADACQPQSLFLLADVSGGMFSSGAPTVMGTTKLPDFAFAGGAVSPATVAPGGTTNISFNVSTRCPASSASAVGIFLTDSALNPLAFIGAVGISAGGGTWSLPPTPVTFSSAIPLATYNILMVADLDRVVNESNEANNTVAFPLTVTRSAASATALAPALARVADSSVTVRSAVVPANAPLPEDVAAKLQDIEFDSPPGYVVDVLSERLATPKKIKP